MDLTTMDGSDLCDVLHYFFEEDNTLSSEELAVSRSNVRTSLYKELYGTTYRYVYTPADRNTDPNRRNRPMNIEDYPVADDDFVDLKPFDPKSEPTKPYFAPTNFDPDSSDPFGGILDAPLK